MRQRRVRRWGALLAISLLIAGCGSGDSRSPPPSGVTCFAAASLTEVIESLAKDYEQQNGVHVATSFASSSTLARQIENGAPADVFLSANVTWVDELESKGLIARRVDLLENRLALVAPAQASVVIQSPDDLTTPAVRKIALADPASVPAGIYAKKALVALGLWEKVEKKIVAGDDVRQALTFVETGEADAGFVYLTDVASASNPARTRVVMTLDPSLTGPVVYPAALTKQGENNAHARAFFEQLTSSKSAPAFRSAGFAFLPVGP